MIEFFVKKPATTIIFVLFFVVLGIVSYFNLYIEETPKIDFPIVTIKTEYPGATPFEVESQVVKKIEDAVAELSGIKKITSKSFENFGIVIVEFHLGLNANVKSVEAKDKVEAILNDLPDNAKKPLVEKFDPLATPVIELVLKSDTIDGRTLYEYADKKLKNKFSSIDGVASIDIYGGKHRQINIKIDPTLAKRYFVSIGDVVDAIRRRNINMPGGLIEKKDNAISIRFMGEFMTVEEMSNMEAVTRDGYKIKLSDIAEIEDGYKKVDSIARFDSMDSVGLSVIKTNDGNTVQIAKDIIKKIKETSDELPSGMELEVASDNSKYIIDETQNTLINIMIGIILTVIILYVFVGNLRITLIASIVIPSSIVSSVFLVDNFGFTINMMTLIAIAMALGTLIANAIVVIEGILEHIERGEDSETAAIKGTKEVTVAVLASAGTNLVVFTPIAFMGGIAGPFMKQFGLTVVFATIFSLFASFSLTPMLCSVLLKKETNTHDSKKFNFIIRTSNKVVEFLIREYECIFDLIFKQPKITVLSVAVILILSTFLLNYVGSELIPKSDEDAIRAKIVMPQGSTIDRTLEVSKQIETIISKIPEVESYLTKVGGEDGVEKANIVLNLISSKNRKKTDLDIIGLLTTEFSKIPDVEIDITRGKSLSTGNGDVTVDLYGDNYDLIIDYSKQLEKLMRESGYFRSVSSSYKNPKTEIRFIPDQDKIIYYGTSYNNIADAVRMSIYGDDSNKYKDNGEEYDIFIEMDKRYKNTFEDIDQIDVITKKGLLPITELGSVIKTKSLPGIWHRDKERVIEIEGYLSKSTSGEVMKNLDKIFDKNIKFKDGYGYKWVGDAEYQSESTHEIGKAFILAAILTYMILVAIMNSFLHPFTISTSIITSFIGVFVFMFFIGSSFNIASMLSMVMLVGIVVNNSILMLDATTQKMNEGLPIKNALLAGTKAKFRAILMTSIAVICGVLPQVFSNDSTKSSMGAVLIGGILASIVFTFVLTPVLFYYFELWKRKFKGV